MTNLIYKNGQEIEIPAYARQVTDNKFVVDINNPLSIASVLKYQIEHWDEEQIRQLAHNGIQTITYGYLDKKGNFESYSGYKNIPTDWKSDYFFHFGSFYYDELVFAKSAVAYPELWPLLEEYSKLLVKASRSETTAGPWATEETILGQFLLFELADQDIKYLYLAEDFSCNVEVRCSPNFHDEYLYSITKLYAKWKCDNEFISLSESISDSELDEDIDYDRLFEALREDENTSSEDRRSIKEFIRLQNQFADNYLLVEDETLSLFATDRGNNSSFIIKNKQKYVSLTFNLAKRKCTIKLPNDVVELSPSDEFFDLVEEVFEELL